MLTVLEVWKVRQKDKDFKASLHYTMSVCQERNGQKGEWMMSYFKERGASNSMRQWDL